MVSCVAKEVAYMKKQIIAGIVITACVALCTAVWPRSTEVEDLPAEPVKAAVNAEIEARLEEKLPIFISADAPAPETVTVAESETAESEVTTEKETEKLVPTQTAQPVKPTPPSEPHMGDVRVVNGEKQIYIDGFGWIKDEGGENVGTVAEDMYENGNKIGIMGGGTMVGNPGDELTGYRVGIMGSDATVGSKGNINKQVGIMGGEESKPCNSFSPPSESPEPIGDVIYVPLQPPVTKDSTPPPYKPNGEPINP